MKDTKTQGILKAASMIVMIMAVAVISVLWIRNDCNSYYVMDKGFIGDKIMLVLEMALAAVIIYMSVRYRKYLISLLTFFAYGITFGIKYVSGSGLDVEYLRIDRFSIMMCAFIATGFILITINRLKNSIEENDKFIWFFVASVAAMGIVLSYDLLWINFFIGLTYFSLYNFVEDKKGIVLIAGMAAQIVLSVGCIFAMDKLSFTSIQSVIVCSAMGISGTMWATIPVLVAGFILLLSSVLIIGFAANEEDSRTFTGAILPVVGGLYILIRFIPAFMGYTLGDVVKYIGVVLWLVFGIILNVRDHNANIKKHALWISGMYVSLIIMFAGMGIPLTTWYILILLIMYIPFILAMYINNGRIIYAQLVTYLFAIFAPLELVCYRMSAFKLYIKSENKIFILLAALAYIVMIVALLRCLKCYVNINMNREDTEKDIIDYDKGNKFVMCISLIILAAAMVLMPYIIKEWVYPLMSQTELMVANLSASKIVTREIVVTSIMAVVTFIVPAVVYIPIRKKQNKQ